MTAPDTMFRAFDAALGFFLLISSPHFLKFFFRKCLDTDSNPMAVLYFTATALSFAVYAELVLVIFRFALSLSRI